MLSTVFMPSFFLLFMSFSSIQSLHLLLQCAVDDCFIPPSSPLSVWLVLLVLGISADLTRGGFAAGSSFSLMREMEPVTAYIRVCGCTCVLIAVSACAYVLGVFECLCMWFCQIACVKYCACVYVWVSVSLCVAVGFVFEHLCVRVSCLASPHTVSNFLFSSSYETEETEHFMLLLNTTFHFLTMCW